MCKIKQKSACLACWASLVQLLIVQDLTICSCTIIMKICIIDDDRICRFIAQRLIEKTVADSEIIQFTNGMDASDFIARHCSSPGILPDVIFLDINMPVANGWEFLDMLSMMKVSNYNPRIYINSSSEDPCDVSKALTYSAVQGYLPKPLSATLLTQILEAKA